MEYENLDQLMDIFSPENFGRGLFPHPQSPPLPNSQSFSEDEVNDFMATISHIRKKAKKNQNLILLDHREKEQIRHLFDASNVYRLPQKGREKIVAEIVNLQLGFLKKAMNNGNFHRWFPRLNQSCLQYVLENSSLETLKALEMGVKNPFFPILKAGLEQGKPRPLPGSSRKRIPRREPENHQEEVQKLVLKWMHLIRPEGFIFFSRFLTHSRNPSEFPYHLETFLEIGDRLKEQFLNLVNLKLSHPEDFIERANSELKDPLLKQALVLIHQNLEETIIEEILKRGLEKRNLAQKRYADIFLTGVKCLGSGQTLEMTRLRLNAI